MMIKKKMEKYLDLLFMDLCAKDNGNQHKSFGLYTFIKVKNFLCQEKTYVF